MDRSKVLSKVRDTVTDLFTQNERPYLLYHNYAHTQNVVARAQEIARFYSLEESQFFVLQAAAWYHDTGHLLTGAEHHEEMSVRLMRMFLGDQVEEVLLQDIAACIMATRMAVSPQSFIEMILCDADTYHLGTVEFRQTDSLVWAEIEMRQNTLIAHKKEKSLLFLEAHQYYTGYCKELLNPGKEENKRWLKNMIQSR